MIYIASPYSNPDNSLRYLRFLASRDYAIELTKQGRVSFSPVAYGHQFTQLGMPGDHEYWLELNMAILRACVETHVLKLPGWDASLGVKQEIKASEELGLPVIFVERKLQ